jgi:hypothetical protein
VKLKKSIVLLALAGLMGGVAPAHAFLNLNGWKIDLEAIGAPAGEDVFTGYGVLGAVGVPPGSNGINNMTFNGLYSTSGVFTGPEVFPGQGPIAAVGDTFDVNLGGVATSFIGDVGIIPVTTTGKIVNFDFELTFVSTTTQEVTTVDPVTFITTNGHLPATGALGGFAPNGYLHVFADVIAGPGDLDGGLKANTSVTAAGGDGLDDGTLIATFKILPSGSLTGSFNPSALDGQDDAVWELISNPYGALLGPDLDILLPGNVLAFTNSNTDGDDDNDGIFNTQPDSGLFAGLCNLPQSNAVNCGAEDGSFNLAIPEPGSLALLGLALAGLAGVQRRRLS